MPSWVAMLIMAKDRTYGELLNAVRGKKVHIWTCNTCARLCYEIGGKASAERLAAKLGSDGVKVTGVSAVAASCMDSSVKRGAVSADADVVIALTCDIGSKLAGDTTGKEMINPINTFGTGMITDENGPVLLTRNADGTFSKKGLLEICGTDDPEDLPFV